nr:hypothetical protein [Leptospira interrogans]
MCVFEPKTRPLGERFAEFNFDSKILLTCGFGYVSERLANRVTKQMCRRPE